MVGKGWAESGQRVAIRWAEGGPEGWLRVDLRWAKGGLMDGG
jgi:hypothetical protein